MSPIKILIQENISAQALIQKHPDLLFKNFKKKSKPYFTLPLTCILALKENRIIALLVSVKLPQKNTITLLSLYVREEFRKKGLAYALVEAFEKHMNITKGFSFSVEYQSDWENTEILETILQKNSWTGKEKLFELFKINLEENLKAEWLRTLPPLPLNARMMLWKELAPEDLKKVSAIDFPFSLSPFQMEERIASNSLALFIENEIRGWLVTHTTKTSVQYTSLYTNVSHRKGFFAMHLMRRAAEIQVAEGKPEALFMIHAENTAMLQMFQNRFAPYCYFHHYIYRQIKTLS